MRPHHAQAAIAGGSAEWVNPQAHRSDDEIVSLFTRILRSAHDGSADRRRAGRVRIETSLQCSLGRVLDLSAGGLSVVSRKPLMGVVVLRLHDEDGGIECEAKVIRSRRLGFFRHEVGLQLPPLDERDHATLNRFCANHRDRLDLNGRRAA